MPVVPVIDEVWIPPGRFHMGSHDHYPEEAPVRRVHVDGFFMDRHPVTNEQFAEFVDDSGHVTVAEVAPDLADFPSASPQDIVPGSMVFTMSDQPVPLNDPRKWWTWTAGADWRHPSGPDSSINGREHHPVVHVAYPDALAYASWAGRQLPSEDEWEYAARGGLDGAIFVWGDEDTQDSAPRANTWQGQFPVHNSELDGWTLTSPVGSYEPNGYGLLDMAGNVWEWTKDLYTVPGDTPRRTSDSTPYVLKGGSHLCTIQYCFRYRPAARQSQTPDTAMSHIGFRCIRRP